MLADMPLLERLLSRLLALLISAAGAGEEMPVDVRRRGERVQVLLPRPAAWKGLDEAALLSLGGDGAGEGAVEGAPLLGTGFSLRLTRNLARELGGALAIDTGGLTLQLPAALPFSGERMLEG